MIQSKMSKRAKEAWGLLAACIFIGVWTLFMPVGAMAQQTVSATEIAIIRRVLDTCTGAAVAPAAITLVGALSLTFPKNQRLKNLVSWEAGK